MRSDRLEHNIWKLYTIKASKWFMVYMPIAMLFYQENGLSLEQSLSIHACYAISTAIMELPSGYFADQMGRRLSIIIGSVLFFIGFVICSLSWSYIGFIIANIIMGFGHSFVSGSDTAILYDSLIELKREKDFLKLEGRSVSLGNFCEAAAAILGGVLAEASLRTPYYVQTLIAFIAVPISFMLIEPSVSKIKSEHSKIGLLVSYVKYAIIDNPSLRWNLLYSSIFGMCTLLMAWTIQPYYKLLDIPYFWIGILAAILNFIVAASSFYSHKIESLFGSKSILIGILLILPLTYAAIGFNINLWSIPILAVFYFVRGIAVPILRDYTNRFTPSEMRATVLSLRSLIIRGSYAVFSPFIGWYADLYSLPHAFILASAIFFITGGIVLFFILRLKEFA